MPPTAALLAQATSADIGAQAARLLELLLTPTGFVTVAFGLAIIVALLVSRSGTILLGSFAIFLLSMMRSESKYADNTLILPLEALRAFSRPVAFALFIILAARMTLVSRGQRRLLVAVPAACLLAYECYYLGLLGLFVDPARAAFGLVAVISVAVTVCLGFGKWLESESDSGTLMRMFGLAGVGFVLANCAQLGLGYSNAILGGRLAGVSGNAQQMAATCCLFMIVACYYFASSRLGSLAKWVAALCMGILGLFVLWSGSRTGAVCTALVLITYFRAKVGRLAIVLLIGAVVLVIAASLFQESTFGVDRFFYGADTRTRVWLAALDEFAKSPLFGSIPTSEDESLNLSESTYLRSLALMGLVGGTLVLALIVTMLWCAFRVWVAGRRFPSLASHADMVVSSTAFMVIVNAAEGLMMGILTIFVVFLYAMFATSAFVLDAAAEAEFAGELGASDDHEGRITGASAPGFP